MAQEIFSMQEKTSLCKSIVDKSNCRMLLVVETPTNVMSVNCESLLKVNFRLSNYFAKKDERIVLGN